MTKFTFTRYKHSKLTVSTFRQYGPMILISPCTSGLRSALKKNSAKRLLNRNDILCVLFEYSEPDEIGINTCLILQNTLDVTVTALAVQNKREHPNRVKGFAETVVPNYCDPTFASHFRMKRQTFQMKDNPLLTSESVMIYMTLLFLL